MLKIIKHLVVIFIVVNGFPRINCQSLSSVERLKEIYDTLIVIHEKRIKGIDNFANNDEEDVDRFYLNKIAAIYNGTRNGTVVTPPLIREHNIVANLCLELITADNNLSKKVINQLSGTKINQLTGTKKPIPGYYIRFIEKELAKNCRRQNKINRTFSINLINKIDMLYNYKRCSYPRLITDCRPPTAPFNCIDTTCFKILDLAIEMSRFRGDTYLLDSLLSEIKFRTHIKSQNNSINIVDEISIFISKNKEIIKNIDTTLPSLKINSSPQQRIRKINKEIKKIKSRSRETKIVIETIENSIDSKSVAARFAFKQGQYLIDIDLKRALDKYVSTLKKQISSYLRQNPLEECWIDISIEAHADVTPITRSKKPSSLYNTILNSIKENSQKFPHIQINNTTDRQLNEVLIYLREKEVEKYIMSEIIDTFPSKVKWYASFSGGKNINDPNRYCILITVIHKKSTFNK